MNENENKSKLKLVLTPIISIFMFTVLVFAAGYAYFTAGSNTMASSQINVTMPNRTTLSCTGTATSSCAISVSYASMVQSANSTTAKNSVDCYLNCTCSGSSGGACAYSINMQAVTAYTPSASLGTGKEFTSTAVMGTGCTAQNSSTTETQVNTIAGKVIATCSISAGTTSNTKVTYKWYNVNINQDAHAGKTYAYKINTILTSLT